MRKFILAFALTSVSAATASGDPCTELCTRDGSRICTDGSWTKGNGVCHAYMFRGDPNNGDYCYHTSANAEVCPSNGTPVRPIDVPRLLAQASRTTEMPTTAVPMEIETELPHETTIPVSNRLGAFLASFEDRDADALCLSLISLNNHVVVSLGDSNLMTLSGPEFWSRVNGPILLRMATSDSRCREMLTRIVIVLSTGAPGGGVDIPGLSLFCEQNFSQIVSVLEGQHSFGEFIGFGADVPRICPRIFETIDMALQGLRHRIVRQRARAPILGQRVLDISLERAFSESTEYLLTDSQELFESQPVVRMRGAGVRYSESGQVLQQWFTAVHRLAFRQPSTDPAGGLFYFSRWGFLEIDVNRPLTAETRPMYRAAGRLMVIGIIQRRGVRIPFSPVFLRRLLNQPLSPEDLRTAARVGWSEEDEARVAEFRRGFSDMIPIDTINSFVTPEFLQFLIRRSD